MLELTKVSTTTGLIEYRFSVPSLGADKIENAVKAILEMAKAQATVDGREDDDRAYSVEEVLGPKDPAAVLRGFRYRDDLTQKQVADAIGATQHRISELENGTRKISKKMAERLAFFFKTSPAVFYDRLPNGRWQRSTHLSRLHRFNFREADDLSLHPCR